MRRIWWLLLPVMALTPAATAQASTVGETGDTMTYVASAGESNALYLSFQGGQIVQDGDTGSRDTLPGDGQPSVHPQHHHAAAVARPNRRVLPARRRSTRRSRSTSATATTTPPSTRRSRRPSTRARATTRSTRSTSLRPHHLRGRIRPGHRGPGRHGGLRLRERDDPVQQRLRADDHDHHADRAAPTAHRDDRQLGNTGPAPGDAVAQQDEDALLLDASGEHVRDDVLLAASGNRIAITDGTGGARSDVAVAAISPCTRNPSADPTDLVDVLCPADTVQRVVTSLVPATTPCPSRRASRSRSRPRAGTATTCSEAGWTRSPGDENIIVGGDGIDTLSGGPGDSIASTRATAGPTM